MKIIDACCEIVLPYPNWDIAHDTILKMIETAGRTCYKSENKITADSAGKFVRRIIRDGHEAMLEHAGMTVRFTIDRGVSYEIVRHRMASFAQESTRYCNYSADKFGNEITVIRPLWLKDDLARDLWEKACENAEDAYFSLLREGWTPEQARCVLPNSLKTEIVVTANMREWRHMLKLRAIGTTGAPHPQMKEVMQQLLDIVKEKLPEIFGDLEG